MSWEIKIWICSDYMFVACRTVSYVRWNHDASQPLVCLAQPCSVSEMIPCVRVFQRGNALTRSWGGKEIGTFLESGGLEERPAQGKQDLLELVSLLLPPPALHQPCSVHSSWGFQSLTLNPAHTKPALKSLSPVFLYILQAVINLCLSKYLHLPLSVFHKHSHALMIS